MNESIFDIVKKNPNYSSKNSWNWYQINVRQLGEAKALTNAPMGLFTANQTMLVQKLIPGWLHMFFYSPKGKDKLPYWDRFPLVIPFRATSTHFWGLNIHYLPMKHRMLLMNKLLQFTSDKTMSERTKLMVSWRLLSNISKFPEVAPCVKQYIIGNVKSKYLRIKAEDWMIAASLPVERFTGANAQAVWKQSRKKIGR